MEYCVRVWGVRVDVPVAGKFDYIQCCWKYLEIKYKSSMQSEIDNIHMACLHFGPP
jgi:hypothetical protein